MPIHDWTRVIAGVFHDFHHEWISTINRALNQGLLPSDYYALAERMTDLLPRNRSRVAISHKSDHEVVAVMDIVSPGNKKSPQAVDTFIDGVVDSLAKGIHVLVIDLFPRGPHDERGIHGAVWKRIGSDDVVQDELAPMTIVAYSATNPICAYLEPIAVGKMMPDMPLFLDCDFYVPVPLEPTYQAAWEGVPAYWRQQLES